MEDEVGGDFSHLIDDEEFINFPEKSEVRFSPAPPLQQKKYFVLFFP